VSRKCLGAGSTLAGSTFGDDVLQKEQASKAQAQRDGEIAQLVQMGFDPGKAAASLETHGSLEAATHALLDDPNSAEPASPPGGGGGLAEPPETPPPTPPPRAGAAAAAVPAISHPPGKHPPAAPNLIDLLDDPAPAAAAPSPAAAPRPLYADFDPMTGGAAAAPPPPTPPPGAMAMPGLTMSVAHGAAAPPHTAAQHSMPPQMAAHASCGGPPQISHLSSAPPQLAAPRPPMIAAPQTRGAATPPLAPRTARRSQGVSRPR